MKGLGRVFNVIPAASGVHIPLDKASAVSFVTYEDDGSTIATIKESVDGASEQALDCDVYPHKAPGIGGTWTAMAEQDDTLDLGDDTTNDAMVFTVAGTQLSDGFNCVEVTVDGGICIAILHDLVVQRDPANLATNITS
ncbi:hypothetical protein RM572_00390 [Streptomyces sp. DSM 42041]|uniref:Uncharacterized protein n=1 Tax=Streptomyces hazeniae TaxID=3075538 RepID=A0ABU2NJR6_9ACTN|nr:hypothetical protein [Streptomyces sp. DSM 42041]MDT0377234.1 hypothetical protein [Streptomyces sp. DSM 42041]